MKRSRPALAPILLAGLLVASGCGESETAGDAARGAAPYGVRATLTDGTPASLASFQGRVLILNVWATWCGPCRRELPGLDRLRARLDPTQVAVAGLALDGDRIAVHEFVRRSGIGYVNYVASEPREAQAALRAPTLPQTLIVAPDGTVIDRIAGARDWDTAAARATIEAALARSAPGHGRPG